MSRVSDRRGKLGVRAGWLALCALVALGACGSEAPPGPDIAARLRQIPGLVITEDTSPAQGYRFFVMTLEQPADHGAPSGTKFTQRITLLHRDVRLPMVLYTAGYFVSTRAGRTEVTALVEGNQLAVEHRFFDPSRPEPADWSLLTLEQAAKDVHRVVSAFKGIYQARWLSVGGSKGGIAALAHRRHFPDDVFGTVAYVAPTVRAEDAVAGAGNRYISFLEQVGSDATCRQALRDFQRLALSRSAELLPMLDALGTSEQTTFTEVLGRERALEFAIAELPFIFWQYGSAEDCASIPDASASAQAIFDFINRVTVLITYGDVDLTAFLPYYFQCANELAYPAVPEDHLSDLQSFPGEDQPEAYLEGLVQVPAFDPSPIADLEAWVGKDASRLILIYGEYDPWTAGAFDIGAATDSLKFIVAKGNHQARIGDLTSTERASVLDALSRWSGIVAAFPPAAKRGTAPARRELDPLDIRWGPGL